VAGVPVEAVAASGGGSSKVKKNVAKRISLKAVANMAPFAISSSLILVIHDNMINVTNHIV
jgi:hypothetical protein